LVINIQSIHGARSVKHQVILHVASEDESFKSKHVVQYTLCPISYAGEQKNIVLILSLFFSQSFNIPI